MVENKNVKIASDVLNGISNLAYAAASIGVDGFQWSDITGPALDIALGVVTNNSHRFGKYKPALQKLMRFGQLGLSGMAVYNGGIAIGSIMAKIEQGRPEDITTEELKGVISFLVGARGVIKAGRDSYVAHKYTERIDSPDVLSGVKNPELQTKIRNRIVDTFVKTPEGTAELQSQKLFNEDGSINYDQAYTYLRRNKKVSNKDVVSAINSEDGLVEAGKAAAKQVSKDAMNTAGL